MKLYLLLLGLLIARPNWAQEIEPVWETVPSISPLLPGESPYITSFFGMRIHPLSRESRMHNGIDLACPRGFQFVYATARGLVSFAGNKPGLGLTLTIDHPSGYRSGYGHLATVYVQAGDTVGIGEVIGLMGETGKATGIHLHYSLSLNGQWVDPLPYLFLYQETIQKETPIGRPGRDER